MSTEEDFLEAVKKTLIAERMAADLTLDDVADRSGVSRATLHRLEKGRSTPDLRQLSKIASVYKMTGAQLMARAQMWMPAPQPPTADDFGLAAHRPKIAHESMEDDGNHAE